MPALDGPRVRAWPGWSRAPRAPQGVRFSVRVTNAPPLHHWHAGDRSSSDTRAEVFQRGNHLRPTLGRNSQPAPHPVGCRAACPPSYTKKPRRGASLSRGQTSTLPNAPSKSTQPRSVEEAGRDAMTSQTPPRHRRRSTLTSCAFHPTAHPVDAAPMIGRTDASGSDPRHGHDENPSEIPPVPSLSLSHDHLEWQRPRGAASPAAWNVTRRHSRIGMRVGARWVGASVPRRGSTHHK